MLKNYLVKDENGIGATLSSIGALCCVRCSRDALLSHSSQTAVACANGHVQCSECDISMRHQCKKCGILTTSVLQHDDIRTKPIDPKTLPPEDLTQLELNASLQQFKLNFLKHSDKKKRRLRLIEATSHIIEILNPSLIAPYRQGNRASQIQVEEHFFRTSEKSQHTFAWHKAALEFIMDRTIDLKAFNAMQRDGGTLNTTLKVQTETDKFSKRNFQPLTNKGLHFLKNYTQQQKCNKLIKSINETISYATEDAEQQTYNFTNEENLEPGVFERSPLILVKPDQWLTEVCCPHCELVFRLSDFSKHFAIYHCLPIECMDLGESRRIFLDPKVMLSRGSYPHTLFLIKNVVRDLGGSEYRNFFPIVLITATFRNDELLNGTNVNGNTARHIMIWLSSICLNNEFNVCLKIISERIACLNHCLSSKKVYPITKPQNLIEIYSRGDTILLPSETFSVLSKNGLDRISLEISLHEINQSSA